MINFDLTKNFVVNRRDINKKTEENSLLESLENIVTMNTGDLVGSPSFGSPTKKLLFQRNTYVALFSLVKQIEFATLKYEPRVSSVVVTADYGKSTDVLTLTIDAKTNDQRLHLTKKI